jgi:hypothetical protein
VGGTIYAATPPFPHLNIANPAFTRSLSYHLGLRGLGWAVTWQTRTMHKAVKGYQVFEPKASPGKWRCRSIS